MEKSIAQLEAATKETLVELQRSNYRLGYLTAVHEAIKLAHAHGCPDEFTFQLLGLTEPGYLAVKSEQEVPSRPASPSRPVHGSPTILPVSENPE